MRIVDDYKGVGYARSTPTELRFLRDTLRRDGLLLDPVYTGKALRGVVETLREDRVAFGPAPVFVHTGGAFGTLAAGHDLETCLEPTTPAPDPEP